MGLLDKLVMRGDISESLSKLKKIESEVGDSSELLAYYLEDFYSQLENGEELIKQKVLSAYVRLSQQDNYSYLDLLALDCYITSHSSINHNNTKPIEMEVWLDQYIHMVNRVSLKFLKEEDLYCKYNISQAESQKIFERKFQLGSAILAGHT